MRRTVANRSGGGSGTLGESLPGEKTLVAHLAAPATAEADGRRNSRSSLALLSHREEPPEI